MESLLSYYKNKLGCFNFLVVAVDNKNYELTYFKKILENQGLEQSFFSSKQYPINEIQKKILNAQILMDLGEYDKASSELEELDTFIKELNVKEEKVSHEGITMQLEGVVEGLSKTAYYLKQEIKTMQQLKDAYQQQKEYQEKIREGYRKVMYGSRGEKNEALESKISTTKTNFDEALHLLKQKSDNLDKKLKDNPKYLKASITAHQLIDDLKFSFNEFYDVLSYNYLNMSNEFIEAECEFFLENCNKAMETARPELEKHRGWKEVLLWLPVKIGNLFMSMAHKPNFFKAKTSSQLKLEQFERDIDKAFSGPSLSISAELKK